MGELEGKGLPCLTLAHHLVQLLHRTEHPNQVSLAHEVMIPVSRDLRHDSAHLGHDGLPRRDDDGDSVE